MSDNEDIDDDILDDEEPSDVPGMIEIHRSAAENRVVVLDPSSNTGAAACSTASPPAKKRTLTLRTKWKKVPACYSKQYPHADEVEKRRNNIISIFRDKTPVECFEQLLDEAIIEDIVQQSVRYATQNNNHQFQRTNACMKKFVGILLFTGYHSLPQEQLY